MSESASKPPLLTVRQLDCERDERQLFSSLDLDIYPGDLLQLEGPNGAGKTSLLRVLAGLLPASSGEVFWQGEPVKQVSDDYYRSLVFIGHLAGIKPELTPLENLRWYAALEGFTQEEDLEKALVGVGLSGFEDQPCHQLSAGQKRRVALARLLFTQRPLWLLDEPFTALDKEGVAAMEALLVAHVADGGAIILTSHHALENLPGLKKLRLGKLAGDNHE
ncbi:cytochrome c biogenesis heme-transporting ATPase CcmA [Marinospirillum perlucidum]|uniref:cytochrome c biogenesis heme-transporting ATPase CcmA n=1 Tax=Marinospirillum perlucidum TaxID=1982602 RepID=UPI000DF1FE88|nr:cytochrome c biogenesis heme-transporting ATPase CcmA [Marinospirillum perlucidum]